MNAKTGDNIAYKSDGLLVRPMVAFVEVFPPNGITYSEVGGFKKVMNSLFAPYL